MENTVVVLLLLCALSSAKKEALSQNNPRPDLPDLCTQLGDIRVQLAKDTLLIEQLQKDKEEQAAKLRLVDSLKLQQEELAAKLRELQTKTSEVDPIKEQLRVQASELKSLKTRTNVTENQVESLWRDRAVGQVAFSASLLASGSGFIGPFNAHTTLVFKHVVSNIGNAYNPNTGFFTAPVRGAYHFEFFVASGRGTHASAVVLMKNTELIYLAHEHQTGQYGSSGNGATVLLEAGDVVSLQLWAHYKIFDDKYHRTTFSGHLLFPK